MGQTQAVAGVGFTPKLVLFWWSGTTATSDGVRGEDINMGFGAMAGASARLACGGGSNDAGASSTTMRFLLNDACIQSYVNGATGLSGSADFSSFDAGGFTIIIDAQFTTNLRVSYLALGGTDLTNIATGIGVGDGDLGNSSVTGLGFQPDALLFLSALGSIAQSTASMSIGMATGSSNQGVCAWGGETGAATSSTYGYGYNGEVIAALYADAVSFARSSFVSMDADGFTINIFEGPEQEFGYIALKGGQYKVHELTTRTDGNDIAESDVGFQPVAVLFASANRALSTQDTTTSHARMSIGAGASTSNRAAQAISDEDNLADTECATGNYDSAIYAHVKDDAIEALMDLKSIDAGGFTCVMDDVETAGCWVTYLAIGAEPVSARRPRNNVHYNELFIY